MLLLQMEKSSIKLAQPKEREERLFMTLNEASQQRTRRISLTDFNEARAQSDRVAGMHAG